MPPVDLNSLLYLLASAVAGYILRHSELLSRLFRPGGPGPGPLVPPAPSPAPVPPSLGGHPILDTANAFLAALLARLQPAAPPAPARPVNPGGNP